MAVTRLTDLIVPTIFAQDYLKATMVRSEVFKSGIVVNDPLMAKLCAANQGSIFNVPFYKDVANTEANVGSDDPAVAATPQNITTGQDIACKQFRNQSWSTMDLEAAMASSDPMARIKSVVAEYWARQYNFFAINTLVGVLNANVAQNSGDMVVNVATDAVGAPSAAEKMSADLILTAKQTMGDAAKALKILLVHSVVWTNLQKLNLIAFIPNDKADVGFGTYLGYSLVVDDSLPAVAGTNRITYTSVLAAPGVLKYGAGAPANPVEVSREALAGNGEGQEILTTRNHFAMHPAGVKWTSSSMAGKSPTWAELATAANWNRVYAERKQIGLAFLKTNG